MPFSKIVNDALEKAAEATGMSLPFLRAIAFIESSGNPKAQESRKIYKGLFQLSNEGFRKHGGKGNIFDPHQNAMAGAKFLRHTRDQLERRLERKPTDAEVYLAHQQGVSGSTAHINHRDRLAWRSMHSTTEGRKRGETWSRRAIWANLPAAERKRHGSVEKITSGDFVDFWAARFARALEQTKKA